MNAPDRMEVVVTKLFARLQGIYGTSFTSKFSTGFNQKTQRDDGWENAKAVWAEDLAGFDLDAIAYGIRNVDPERAPSSRMFVELCRKAPRKATQQALPYRPTDEDRARLRAVASEAAKAVTLTDYDPLTWARKPKSQKALDMVLDGAKRNMALAQIVVEHVANGICNEAGKLLKRYKGQGQWVKA
jgi:hypothetical protein